MSVYAELNTDTAQVADMVSNIESMSQKFLGGIDHLKTKLNNVQADSPQSLEAKEAYLHIIKQLEENVVPKVQHTAKVADEFKEDIIAIEGNANLFADAQATKSEAERAARSKMRRS